MNLGLCASYCTLKSLYREQNKQVKCKVSVRGILVNVDKPLAMGLLHEIVSLLSRDVSK